MAGLADDDGELDLMVGAPVGQDDLHAVRWPGDCRRGLKEQAELFGGTLDPLECLAVHALIDPGVLGVQLHVQPVVRRRGHHLARDSSAGSTVARRSARCAWRAGARAPPRPRGRSGGAPMGHRAERASARRAARRGPRSRRRHGRPRHIPGGLDRIGTASRQSLQCQRAGEGCGFHSQSRHRYMSSGVRSCNCWSRTCASTPPQW